MQLVVIILLISISYALICVGRMCLSFKSEWQNKYKYSHEKSRLEYEVKSANREVNYAKNETERQRKRAEHYKSRCSNLRYKIYKESTNEN